MSNPDRRLTFHIEVPSNITMKAAKEYVIEAVAFYSVYCKTPASSPLRFGLCAKICTQDSLKLEQK